MGLLNIYDDWQKKQAMMSGQPSTATPPYVPQQGGLLGLYDKVNNFVSAPQPVEVPPIQTENMVSNLGMTPTQPTVPQPQFQMPQTPGLDDDKGGLRKMLFRMFGG